MLLGFVTLLVGMSEAQSTSSKAILLLVIRLTMLVQYFRKPFILCSFNSKKEFNF